MADEKILEVLLRIRSDQADLQKLIGGLKETKTAAEDVAKSGFSFGDAFKFAGAEEGLRRMIDLLKQVPERMVEMIKGGVEFNAELQKVQTSLAGVLLQTQPEKYSGFASAFTTAGVEVDKLKDKANELGLKYDDMFETFQHIQAVLSSGAGITDFNQQLQLAVTLTRALQTAGVNSSIAFRDIADILRGQASIARVGGTAMAGLMGFQSAQELDVWTQQMLANGTLVQGLMEKLAGIKTTSIEMGQTFQAKMNDMHNAILDFEGAAAQPIMQPLTRAIEDFTAALKSDEVKNWAKTFGETINVIDMAVRSLVQDIDNLIHKIPSIPEPPEWMKSAIATFTRGLGSLVPGGTTAFDLGQTVGDIHADVAAQTEAENAAKKHLDTETGITREHKLQLTALEAIALVHDKIKLLTDEAAGDKEAIAADKAKIAYDEMYKTLVAKKVPEAEAKQLAQDYANAVQAAAQHLLDVKSVQKDITEFTREQALALAQVRNAQELIKQNPFLTLDEKDVLLIPLIHSELTQLNAEIAKGKALMAGGTLDPAQYDHVATEVSNLQTKVTLLNFELQKLSFGGALQAGLVQWVNAFGTAAQQVSNIITGTLNTAIGSTAQAITGLITGTKNWQQVFASAATTIIEHIIQIALQFAVQRLFMSVFNRAAGTVDATAATVAAAPVAAAWSAAATSASIATYGVADTQGLGAYIAALAGGKTAAIASAGFQRGGFTGSGNPNEIAGPAHKEEFYFTAEETQALGVPFLQKLAAAAGGVPRFHSGGYITPEQWFSNPGAYGISQAREGGFNYYNPFTGQTLWALTDYSVSPPYGIDIPPATGPGSDPNFSVLQGGKPQYIDTPVADLAPTGPQGGPIVELPASQWYWAATSLYGTYGVDWFYDAAGDPRPAAYFSGGGTPPVSGIPGGSGPMTPFAAWGGGITPKGAFYGGIWSPSGIPSYSAQIGEMHAMNAALALGLSGGIGLSGGLDLIGSAIRPIAVSESAGMWQDLEYRRGVKSFGSEEAYLASVDEQTKAMEAYQAAQLSRPIIGWQWVTNPWSLGGGAAGKPGPTADPFLPKPAVGWWSPIYGPVPGTSPLTWISHDPAPVLGPGGYYYPTASSTIKPPVTIGGPSGIMTRRHSGGAIDEMLVIAQLGEFMVQRSAVDYYGPDFMQALNDRKISVGRHHEGGPVSSGAPLTWTSHDPAAPTGDVHVYIFHDLNEAVQQYDESSHARKVFRKSMQRNRI